MKLITTYRFLITGIVYLVLIGQLWINTVPYSGWLTKLPLEHLERSFDTDEKETEEKETTEITVEKHLLNEFLLASSTSFRSNNIYYTQSLSSSHHPEINTPPPRSCFFLS